LRAKLSPKKANPSTFDLTGSSTGGMFEVFQKE
jgi:hypothetical protein